MINVALYVPCIHTVLVFGFSPTEYVVHENDRSVAIEVFFILGIPGDYQPQVLISARNGTAIGQIRPKFTHLAIAIEHGRLEDAVLALLSIFATEGTDFAAIPSPEVTFTAGNRIKQLTISIMSSNSTERREAFTVTLDEVTLTHASNKMPLNLSDQEQARLILNPRIASITILDDNGEWPPIHYYVSEICR